MSTRRGDYTKAIEWLDSLDLGKHITPGCEDPFGECGPFEKIVYGRGEYSDNLDCCSVTVIHFYPEGKDVALAPETFPDYLDLIEKLDKGELKLDGVWMVSDEELLSMEKLIKQKFDEVRQKA